MSSFNSTIVANGGSGGQAGGNPTSGACGVGGTGTTTNGQNASGPNPESSNWTGTAGGNTYLSVNTTILRQILY